MEGVVSHGVHDLSCIEVYQHHDEHTQTNGHKDVRAPKAQSAPPCSIPNQILCPGLLYKKFKVQCFVFFSMIFSFGGFFLLYTQRALQRSKAWILFTMRNIQQKKRKKRRLQGQTKIGGVCQADAQRLMEKGPLDKKVSRKRFLSL